MTQFGKQLNQWDREYYQPLMASVGSILTSIGSEGILKPVVNIGTAAQYLKLLRQLVQFNNVVRKCVLK